MKEERPRFLVGVKVIIENSEGEILVLNRSGKTGVGWSLPGGGMDQGEDVVSAVTREVLEETTLTVSNPQIFSVKTHLKDINSAIVLGFVVKPESGEVNLNWEHTDFKWIEPEKSLDLDLTLDGRYFIEEYIKQQ